MSQTSLPPLDPDLLSKILAKTATELTDAEVDLLIAALRAERATYQAAEAANKKKPKSEIAKAASSAASAAAIANIKFEDLNLDL